MTKIILISLFGLGFLSRIWALPVITGAPAAKCSLNETVAHCPFCDKDCSHLFIFNSWSDRSTEACPTNCGENIPVCVCKRDFFRNPNGDCVKKEECPPACPWANEVANYCDQPFEPRCQPTCSNPEVFPNGTLIRIDPPPDGPRFYCQYGICHTLVCACREGFVRDDVTLACVQQGSCPTLRPAPSESG